ncbi:sensor histidine kinase [Spirillospora sp. CA-294931]|uniref:sensor histidine kinase n=1 Tax=Spirillospora sp. CA-294931 TaxID=3240042 RepID=UPI003D8D3C0C
MSRMWRESLRHPRIRTRVTISAVVISGLLATALCALMLVQIREQEADELRRDLGREGRRIVARIFSGDLERTLYTGDRELIQVVDLNGRLMATSPDMESYPPISASSSPDDDEGDNRRDFRSCEIKAPGGDCFLVVEFITGHAPAHERVYSLAPEPGLFPRPGQAALLALLVPLIAGLIGIGTWRSVGRSLRPVDDIRRELDEITATDLERRVPVPDRMDEVGHLALSVNATLDRLEEAVARQRGFVSDVSHELRSPLTGLRTELELAMSEPDSSDVRETLEAVLRNAERLHAVLDDLLAIAQLDSQRGLPSERVELGELADQEVLRRPRRARVTVWSDDPVFVRGGRSELGRLLTNLIDNADRHAESAVTVTVRSTGRESAVVEVADDGKGVALADRDRIFERFTRLAESRHRDAGGTGLGLAISRDIAMAHGGSLIITDRPDGEAGARFLLRLPLDHPDPG